MTAFRTCSTLTCFGPRTKPLRGIGACCCVGIDHAYDNAMCESFFANPECELLDRRKFPTKAEARMAIFEFIEGWCNPDRRHSALGHISPVDYEWSAIETLEFSSP